MEQNGTSAESIAGRRIFRFGPFELNARARRLSRNGSPIKLTAKTFDILLYLVERAGRIVSRDEMLDEIWQGDVVEDGNLSVHISALRKMLGDVQAEARYIATIPRKGYSFVALVEKRSDDENHATAGGYSNTVAAKAADHPLPHITNAGKNLEERLHTSSAEAYRTYLKGRRALRQLTSNSIEKALGYFEKAVELDPGYAHAHVRVGLSYYYLNAYQQIEHDEALAEIKRSVDRAFDLNPSLSEAHTLRGIHKMVYEWDHTSAEEDLRLGVELEPTSVFARCAYANALTLYGRFDEAWEQLNETLAVDDPLSLTVNTLIGSLLFVERRFEECVVHLQEMLEIHPTSLLATLLMSLCFQQLGDLDGGVARMRDAHALDPSPEITAYLAETLAVAGETEEARQILNEIEVAPEPRPVQAFYLYLALGETDQAFDFFERSLLRREVGHLAIFVDPRLDRVREDSRFVSILRRMNFPE